LRVVGPGLPPCGIVGDTAGFAAPSAEPPRRRGAGQRPAPHGHAQRGCGEVAAPPHAG
jgi:hypothetical protein